MVVACYTKMSKNQEHGYVAEGNLNKIYFQFIQFIALICVKYVEIIGFVMEAVGSLLTL